VQRDAAAVKGGCEDEQNKEPAVVTSARPAFGPLVREVNKNNHLKHEEHGAEKSSDGNKHVHLTIGSEPEHSECEHKEESGLWKPETTMEPPSSEA
jgi:hypothetical protein